MCLIYLLTSLFNVFSHQIIFHGTDRKSLHQYLSPKCLPIRYGGVTDIESVDGSQWYELLVQVNKEYEGKKNNIIHYFMINQIILKNSELFNVIKFFVTSYLWENFSNNSFFCYSYQLVWLQEEIALLWLILPQYKADFFGFI